MTELLSPPEPTVIAAGTPFRDLVERVLADARDNIDLLPQRRNVLAREDGSIALIDSKLDLIGEFNPTAYAHGQVASALGYPRDFYHRLRTTHPKAWTTSVNALMWEAPEEAKMVRTRRGDLRAFLSSRYRRLDNEEVLAALLPLFEERGLEVKSCEVTETRLYVQAVTPRLEQEVRVGDAVQAGIVVQNSEVGASSLSVKPLVYRLACRNGMIAAEASRAFRHLGARLEGADDRAMSILSDETRAAQDKATVLAVRDIVDHFTSPAGFDEIVARMRDAAQAVVPGDAFQVVQVLGKAHGLRETEAKGVLEAFLQDADRTRWGLANAVTAQAKTSSDYDRAVELEALGGKVMVLAGPEWSELSRAGL